MKVKNWEKPETCLQSLVFSVTMLFDKTFSQSPPVPVHSTKQVRGLRKPFHTVSAFSAFCRPKPR